MIYPLRHTFRTWHCLGVCTSRVHQIAGLCAVRRQSQLFHQSLLSGGAVLRREHTDMVDPMAYAYQADPADLVESDSEFHGVLLRAPKNHVKQP